MLQRVAACCSVRTRHGHVERQCGVLQYVAVYCGVLCSLLSLLQCATVPNVDTLSTLVVCCSVLWCVVVCSGVLRCVTMCCGVLWCVPVCSGEFRCVAVCNSVLQCVDVPDIDKLSSIAACSSVFQRVAVRCRVAVYYNRHVERRCGVMQFVAVCCSVLQRVAMCCSVL